MDELPGIFTTPVLLAHKRAHEESVRARMVPQNAVQELGLDSLAGLCGDTAPIHAWQVHQTTLLACSFGSPPLYTPSGRWVGSGIQFLEMGRDSLPQQLFTCSEAEPDIEYWLADGSFHIIQQTVDPRSGAFRQLAELRFDLSTFPSRRSLEVLLEPEGAAGRDITAIAHEIRSISSVPTDGVELLLYDLRDAGIYDPGRALQVLSSIEAEPWFDGAIAETAHAIHRELTMIVGFRAAG